LEQEAARAPAAPAGDRADRRALPRGAAPHRRRGTAARDRNDERTTMSELSVGNEASAAPMHSVTVDALVGVVMGSGSDWDVMQHAAAVLRELGVPFETRVVSAHRMPDEMFDYAARAR